MRRSLPLGAVGLLAAVLVPAAKAVDYSVQAWYPGTDQAGFRAAAGGGFAACGAGAAGNMCRTPGVMTANVAPNTAIPAWNAADFVFTPPTGTQIIAGTATLKWRNPDPSIGARLLYRTTGAWSSIVLPVHPTIQAASVSIPAGVAQFAPSLYARASVPAGRITNSTHNTLEVQYLHVWLRDAAPPALAVRAGGAFGDNAWHRGTICGHADATDGGLGVYAVSLELDGRAVSAPAPAGTLLQPRPRAFGADLCLDSALLHDGYLTGLFRATDGHVAGGNAAAPVVRGVHVDNTAPALTATAPADTPDRQPELVVRASDAASGLATVTAKLGSVAVPLVAAGDGSWRGRPTTPLPYGTHTARVQATDVAGNAVERTATVTVADRVPPVLDGFSGGQAGFAFAARDGESGITAAGLAVALDGRDVDAAGSFAGGLFRYVAPSALAAGLHTVAVRATDGVGNVASQQWLFTVAAAPAPLALQFAVTSVTLRPGATRVQVRAYRGPVAERGLRVGFAWSGGPVLAPSVTDERGVADLVLDGTREGTVVASAAGLRAQLAVRLVHAVTLGVRRVPHGIRLSGTVFPAAPAVVLEAYARGRWRPVRTIRVVRRAFTTRLTLRKKGLYIFRATTGDLRSPSRQVWFR